MKRGFYGALRSSKIWGNLHDGLRLIRFPFFDSRHPERSNTCKRLVTKLLCLAIDTLLQQRHAAKIQSVVTSLRHARQGRRKGLTSGAAKARR